MHTHTIIKCSQLYTHRHTNSHNYIPIHSTKPAHACQSHSQCLHSSPLCIRGHTHTHNFFAFSHNHITLHTQDNIQMQRHTTTLIHTHSHPLCLSTHIQYYLETYPAYCFAGTKALYYLVGTPRSLLLLLLNILCIYF